MFSQEISLDPSMNALRGPDGGGIHGPGRCQSVVLGVDVVAIVKGCPMRSPFGDLPTWRQTVWPQFITRGWSPTVWRRAPSFRRPSSVSS